MMAKTSIACLRVFFQRFVQHIESVFTSGDETGEMARDVQIKTRGTLWSQPTYQVIFDTTLE